MPSKKKKYNARFPPARIKKIMQTDEEVGKVASAVPVIISRSLELFVEGLLLKASEITTERCARTLTPSHLKGCIQGEPRFDFLKELVDKVPDLPQNEDEPVLIPPRPTNVRSGRPRGRPRLSSGSNRNSAHSQSESDNEDGAMDLVVDTRETSPPEQPRQSVIQHVGHIRRRPMSRDEEEDHDAAATLATLATMGSPKIEPPKPAPVEQEPQLALQGCPAGVTIQIPSISGLGSPPESVPTPYASYSMTMPMQYRSATSASYQIPVINTEDDDYDS